MANKQTSSHSYTSLENGSARYLVLGKRVCFFLSVSCVSAQRKPFLLRMDSPSLSPDQSVCSPSQTHLCLSLTSPHFRAVGDAGLQILTTLPKSLAKAMAIESRASQQEPPRALLSPGYLRCAGTDMSTVCRHLPPLPCHAVSPLDLKMIKLFSCGAYSANTPICIIQAECHCIFSLCFCTSLFQPIYFLWDFHLFPTSNLK